MARVCAQRGHERMALPVLVRVSSHASLRAVSTEEANVLAGRGGHFGNKTAIPRCGQIAATGAASPSAAGETELRRVARGAWLAASEQAT